MLLFSGFRSDELTAINQKFNKKKACLDSPPESLCSGMPLRKSIESLWGGTSQLLRRTFTPDTTEGASKF